MTKYFKEKQLSDETYAAVYYKLYTFGVYIYIYIYTLVKLFFARSFYSIIYQKACCQKCTS